MKRILKNEIKHPKTETQIMTGVGSSDGACTTRAATGDLLSIRNPPEDLGSTEKPPTSPWKTSRDPHAPDQVETSLSRVGHVPSMKDRHSRGRRLLDWKKPATTVVRRVSWKNPSKWTDLKPKKETQTNKDQVRDAAEKTHQKITFQPKSRLVFCREKNNHYQI